MTVTVSTEPKERLRVVVAGAGLCGLSVGMALREFADVTILERASSLSEIGAAVTVAPNAHRILRKFGATQLVELGSMFSTGFKEWDASTDTVLNDNDTDFPSEDGVKGLLCHRIDLQQELYRLAVAKDGPGQPCKVLFNKSVTECDPEAATVTTCDGSTYAADVIVGADGIRSTVRNAVAGGPVPGIPSGQSGFRTLLSGKAINADPELAELGLMDGRISVIHGDHDEWQLVTYPTRRGEVLNIMAAVPDRVASGPTDRRWNTDASPEQLSEAFKSYPPRWRKLLSLAENVGLWQLRDLDTQDRWVKGRTIILGDGAHAMLPFQGQGAAMAFEDAEALSLYLREVDSGRDTAAIHDALDRVFRVRHPRTAFIHDISRAAGIGEQAKRYRTKMNEGTESKRMDRMKWFAFLWDYRGAEAWEREMPDWVLPKA